MKKLELKHIVPYLPYGLKGVVEYSENNEKHTRKYCLLDVYDFECDILTLCPILRPLSDLVKYIEHNGEKFVPIDELTNGDTVQFNLPDYSLDFGNSEHTFEEYISEWTSGVNHHLDFIPFGFIQKLFEWHFDVFGLIDAGLAIDINNLKK